MCSNSKIKEYSTRNAYADTSSSSSTIILTIAIVITLNSYMTVFNVIKVPHVISKIQVFIITNIVIDGSVSILLCFGFDQIFIFPERKKILLTKIRRKNTLHLTFLTSTILTSSFSQCVYYIFIYIFILSTFDCSVFGIRFGIILYMFILMIGQLIVAFGAILDAHFSFCADQVLGLTGKTFCGSAKRLFDFSTPTGSGGDLSTSTQLTSTPDCFNRAEIDAQTPKNTNRNGDETSQSCRKSADCSLTGSSLKE